ncbi:hypothetical protein BD779DRAFT_343019 [Infundibulicybe gibba]|nr:hypothetical protein BD779DRAFT_343019 [Infundibulicybe gibba]
MPRSTLTYPLTDAELAAAIQMICNHGKSVVATIIMFLWLIHLAFNSTVPLSLPRYCTETTTLFPSLTLSPVRRTSCKRSGSLLRAYQHPHHLHGVTGRTLAVHRIAGDEIYESFLSRVPTGYTRYTRIHSFCFDVAQTCEDENSTTGPLGLWSRIPSLGTPSDGPGSRLIPLTCIYSRGWSLM